MSTLGTPLRAHHEDDVSWHVLKGTLRFTFADRTVDAGAGSTFVVPAGVPHTYESVEGDGARYLLILTPRLGNLIAEAG